MFSWKDSRRRQQLPIDDHLAGIVSATRQNKVVIVEAETGAGKTTRIPQAILLEEPRVKVWMTQTRRPAVRSNGARIAWEMGSEPGGIVGWQLRGEPPVKSAATRLLLVIDQTLVNLIRRLGRLPEGYLIIDEAHERQISTDLLLGLIKEYLPTSPDTHVIVTSATIDTQKFSAYFGGAPVISVNGRMFSVEVKVVNLPYAEHHSQTAIADACAVMESFAKGELTIARTDGEGRVVVREGSVLVLLPGKEDIEAAVRQLAAQAKKLGVEDRVEIIPCHGQMTGTEQDRVFDPIPVGTLRFMPGTEILRTGITPPAIVGVCDSLQVKRLVTDAKGVAHLQKIAISKAEADQGAGRAGRVQSGFYHPCSFGGEYYSLQPYPQPAILQQPITSVVLEVAASGFNARTFDFIDKPASDKVSVAVTRLIKLGALDADEKITQLGRLMVQFPVDPERARTLITANDLGVLVEAIIAVAVLEVEQIRFRPKEARDVVVVSETLARRIIAQAAYSRYFGEGTAREYRQHGDGELPRWATMREDGLVELRPGESGFPHREGAKWVCDLMWQELAGKSRSDFVAMVAAYRAFKAEEYRLRDLARDDEQRSRRWVEDQLFDWCKRNHLNLKRMRMVENTIQQLKDEVATSPLRLENGINQPREFDAEDLTKALASGHVDYVCRSNGGRGYTGPMGDDLQLGWGSALTGSHELVLIGGVHKIPVSGRRGGTSYVNLIDAAAPVKADWLTEVMPQLCEPRVREGTAKFNPLTGVVDGMEDVYYGNVVIKSNPVQVKGADAAKAIAEAMMNQKTCLPAEWLAKFYRDQVVELGTREGVSRSIQTPVRDWFVARLTAAKAVSRDDARATDLLLSDDIVSEMLGFDYPEYRARIRLERPDMVVIGGYACSVKYSSTWGTKPVRATISIPCLLGYRLTAEMLPSWVNVVVTVTVNHPDYRSISVNDDQLDQLASAVETRRQELAWETFRKAGHGDNDRKIELAYDPSEPQLPAIELVPIVWDRVRRQTAHPAYVLYTTSSSYASADYGRLISTAWNVRWFKSADEANEAQAKAENSLREMYRKEYERLHFAEMTAEAQAKLIALQAKFAMLDLARYASYGLNADEAGKGYWHNSQSLAAQIEQSGRLAGVGGYQAKPASAIAEIERIDARLEQALATFAANEAQREPATLQMATAQELHDAIYASRTATYEQRNAFTGTVRDMREQFYSGNYVGVLANAEAIIAQASAMAESLRVADAAREELEALLSEWGYGAAFVLVREDGTVLVNCGRATKMGRMDISPSEGERQHGPESLDDEGRELVWQPIPAGRFVTVSDYASSGRLKEQVSFAVPVDLPFGCWAVTQDGNLFYPVSHWQGGREILPSALKVVRTKTSVNRQILGQIQEQRERLARIERERVNVAWEWEQVEEAYIRQLVEKPEKPIKVGTLFEVTVVAYQIDGRDGLQTEPFWHNGSKKMVQLVLDPYANSTQNVSAGDRVLVRARARSSQRLELFVRNIRDAANHSQLVHGYFAVPIISVEALDRQISELKQDIAALEFELEVQG